MSAATTEVASGSAGFAPVGGFGASLLQMTLALVAVCALAALVLWLLRRRMPGTTGPLRIRAQLSLDPRHTLYIVEAAGKNLLVGAGDGALATLAELDATQVAALDAAEARTSDAGAIGGILRRVTGGRSS